MARKEKIQYINTYYAAGSAARKLERQPERKQAEPIRHAAAPAEKITVYVDPVAVVGTVVALALLVCMVIGVVQMNGLNAQIQAAESYIAELESQQEKLEAEYKASYDPEEIRIQAEALGMVDSSQVRHITVAVPQPLPQVEEPTWWEELLNALGDFFA